MLITVAICTRNRSAALSRTLRSLERLHPVGCAWELLIVDNGSTDGTQGVIKQFEKRLPVRAVLEPRPGLAVARNTAVTCARGDYMVCTDDDVIVKTDWLAAYVAAFTRWPDAALFGGRIIPVLEEPVTPWFPSVMPHLGFPFAARNLSTKSIALMPDGDTIPFGANYAVRTEVQRLFLFDPELGAGKLHFGEETTCFMAMLMAGHEGRWLPDCVVEHMIGPERQNEGYIAGWFNGLGRTEAWRGECSQGPHLFGAPRWLWLRLTVRTLDYRLSRLYAQPEVWIRKLIVLAQDRGRMQHFRSAR